MEALVISHTVQIAWRLPHLLSRAGFAVDVVTNAPLLRHSRFVRKVHIVPGSAAAFAEALAAQRAQPYDWVIAAEDIVLSELAQLERRAGAPSPLLPLLPDASRRHLCSKIGLSLALQAAGIRTPEFRVAASEAEAVIAARKIGYPVLLKLDDLGGGNGVWECRNDADITARRGAFVLSRLKGKPILVQKFVAGAVVDLSAIYRRGELVHFSYAMAERNLKPFAPSVVRRYTPSPHVEEAAFAELRALGHTLGIDGFTNITAIEAADGSGRTYIEADVRPNAWVDVSHYFGEDAAPRLRAAFLEGKILTKEIAAPASPARAPMRIAYFLRLRLWELLLNRYRVWSFLPTAEAPLMARLILIKFLDEIFHAAGKILPKPWRPRLRLAVIRAGWLLP